MLPTSNPRFAVPIAPLEDHPGGTIVCSEPSSRVYLLTFDSPPDNRLTHHFIESMLTALDIVEAQYPPGVVVTTSAIPKFYTNGMDLAITSSLDRFMETHLYKLMARFLSYPMPTVALINGHAFAGGFMWAMHHDYRVFAGARGYLCVNELDFGAPIPPPLLNIYHLKAKPGIVRETVLEARRWTGPAALDAGLVDDVGGWDHVVKLVEDRGLVEKGTTGAYRMLKRGLYRDQLNLLENAGNDTAMALSSMQKEDAEIDEAKRRAGSAKL